MADITRANWGKLLDPGIRKVFHDQFTKTQPMYTEFFAVNRSQKATEQDLTGVGLEDWRQSGEGRPASFTEDIQGFTKNYAHNVWKSGFRVTREMVDDDLYNIVKRDSEKLAQTAIRTIDKQAASVFNNAFNTTYFTGADGAGLCSSSHTREDGGANLSNTYTGVFNEANLETILVDFHETKDGRGELIDIDPDTLIVPPALEKEALIMMKSTGRVSTANNDVNVYNGRLRVAVWKRLGAAGGGSDTQWFVVDSKLAKNGSGLNVFMRVNPEIQMKEEDETHIMKWIGYMRFSLGFTDWRAVRGSTGTV